MELGSLHGVSSHGGKLSKGLPFLANAKAKLVPEKSGEGWDSRDNSSSRLPPSQQEFTRKNNGLAPHYEKPEKRKGNHKKYQDKYDSPGTLTSEDSTDEIFPARSHRYGQKYSDARQTSTSRTTLRQSYEPGLKHRFNKEATKIQQAVQFPITPYGALKHHSDKLTDFEQSEVLEYPKIYYLGENVKKIKGSPITGKNNHGFDDENGDYQVIVRDHVGYRYEVQGLLGKGSFGQVMKCLDHKTNTVKAVKVIRNKKRFHHQALIEVKILEHLRHKDVNDEVNIVHTFEYFYFRNHLCISFELLSINLYEFIRSNNFQGLSLSLIRRFASQILVALKFLKKERVIHCDLKPENILLKQPSKSAIKVIDFGSSCFEDERVYTYIQSRFYRAPEVILGLPYDVSIDIWSFGCILAELYTGYPLFAGENESEQLACIMEILGLPPKRMLDLATRKKLFFDEDDHPKLVVNSRNKRRRPGNKTLSDALRCTDQLFISFLEGCLKWDIEKRFTPEEAMQHKWIQEGHMTMSSYRNYRNSEGAKRSPYGKHKHHSSKPYMSYLKSSHEHLTQTYGKSLSHIPPSQQHHHGHSNSYESNSSSQYSSRNRASLVYGVQQRALNKIHAKKSHAYHNMQQHEGSHHHGHGSSYASSNSHQGQSAVLPPIGSMNIHWNKHHHK
ncbi:dual-specificity tyrosine-phosphorylation-regulated kinase [Chloropicon primus]|uniref:dual-specificity kinase n=1 Tax=Chloropicon primus TaxID=1764295 RepID=A0A5B8MJ85_9CHLO|nr:dual-specificity tyrosine-phosphorylation-regulated kinase [Chloropicon primus]UPQ99697.1 dual-specificity tyrosine-phosphorylation-regulated kinase [Chloropicon primus]|eukprot:QDZ20487.1 dual-specificity tyrosine-phosphorylation-regulated kinase [Chloropicon primus]